MRAAAGAGPGRSQGSLAMDDAHGGREGGGGPRRGRTALRRANVRLALVIGAVALAFYALMLVTGGGR